LVGQDRLAPLALPSDGPSELARRPQHQLVLGVLPALGTEGAADVAGDDPDLVLGNLEDAARERIPDAMRGLDVGVEGVAILVRGVDAEGAARLHEVGVTPCDHVAPSFDALSYRGDRLG